jgi:hypothetical protein
MIFFGGKEFSILGSADLRFRTPAHPQGLLVTLTFRLELQCAAPQQLLHLLWLNRLPSPSIFPPRLRRYRWRHRLRTALLVGLGHLRRRIFAFQSGKESRHCSFVSIWIGGCCFGESAGCVCVCGVCGTLVRSAALSMMYVIDCDLRFLTRCAGQRSLLCWRPTSIKKKERWCS